MPFESDLPDEAPRPSSLPLVLGLATLGGVLLFLIIVSGGFFLYVLLACFGVFGLGFLHYLLWGGRLHQATEGVREEERVRREMDDGGW